MNITINWQDADSSSALAVGEHYPKQSSCFVAGMQLVLTKKLLKTSKPNETLQALNRRPSRRSTQKWTLLSVTVQTATVLGVVAF